ncbi:MAG: ORF6N domain-containing protein [Bacteroidetes bacterium]|nr:ORF6N domain-containing protein [Bacteroidota bacterium]
MANEKSLIPAERIESSILLIRGQKVMLDRDLASLYNVPVKVLNQAVKRNSERFPDDFMFRLTMEEARAWWKHVAASRLRSQFVTLKRGEHIKYRPFAFTEHGILMLSSVLKSERAIQANISIMRTFVRMREMLASNDKLTRRLDELERKYDAQFKVVFEAIREILRPPEKPKRPIGFQVREPKLSYSTRGRNKT